MLEAGYLVELLGECDGSAKEAQRARSAAASKLSRRATAAATRRKGWHRPPKAACSRAPRSYC
eukprot:6180485-Pleurochrysis_carterae.AAC.6